MPRLIPLAVALAGGCLSCSAAAYAAGGAEAEGGGWDLVVKIALALAAGWYAAGALRLWGHGAGPGLAPQRAAAFACGLVVLVVGLLSPIDGIAEQLFSVHMLQHLLLMLAAPPLLVWSRPGLIFLWALPRRWRKAIGRQWVGLGLGRGMRGLTHPFAVWFAFCGVFAFWHLPGPYRWAFTHPAIHVLEHVSFFVTALAFWSIVMAPYGRRRLSYPGTLVFILTTAILSGLPGALMIFSPRAFYAVHAAGVAAWHMSLLEDQQIAGLVMWIPAGLIYVGAALWVFAAWLRAADGKRAPGLGRYALALPLVLLLLPALGACERKKDPAPKQIAGADLAQGARLIRWYGCGGCHVIPGIDDATGVVGPSLAEFADRVYVAGMLRNSPENLETWLRDPQRIVPGNAMPAVGMTAADARDIAGYLYTLR